MKQHRMMKLCLFDLDIMEELEREGLIEMTRYLLSCKMDLLPILTFRGKLLKILYSNNYKIS